uniref:Cadherin domain-containing protein n=4 Tax=Clastoptera arizonana TaxID=38151 RepID=A0A1B6ECX7_9HEMI
MATSLLRVVLLFITASHLEGCQFYPIGEYLRFVRVQENLPVGGEVLQVEVHPRRNLTIQHVDKTDDIAFFRYRSVNKTVVSVRLAQSLEDLVDSESPRNVLKFRLVCDYDDGDDTITSYLSVTVYVEDVNDHSPKFLNTPYHVTVDELTPPGITVFRGIHAVDEDKPNTPNSDLQYSIAKGNERGKFALETSPKPALVLRGPLDFDTGDTHFMLTILASDRGTPSRNSSTQLEVTIQDNDDLNPKFTRDVYRTQITEIYPVTGKRIHQELLFNPPIQALDQDKMINASLQYDLISGNERHLFSINQQNGSLFLERELDLDTLPGNTFTLQIQASQIDNPLKTGIARIEVELLDINDNQPQFEVELYNISIVENLPNGFSVLQVMATDQDQGDNGEFVYHLVDPNQAFSIDGRSGWLTVRNQAKLDREERPSLTMKVLAREKLPSVITPPSDAFVSVEVTLLDANDNNPVFVPSNLYEFVVADNVPQGYEIGKVKAIDPDLGRNGMVLYELQRSNITGSYSQHFTVEAQTGQVLVTMVPLPIGKQTLFIEASDQPVNPSERRFSLAVVTVKVLESGTQKHSVPDFISAPYEFWVGSDVGIGTSIGQIRVNDAVNKKKVIYDLLHSYHEGVPFAVEERSGTITVIDNMEKYDRGLYDFEAVISDEDALTLITNVTIHVVHADSVISANTNKNSPTRLEFRVRENLSGALVGQLMPGFNHSTASSYWKSVKFVIANEPDVLAQFAVSQDGTIYTQRGLDREAKDSYQLTIIAENNRGLSTSRGLFQVSVTVEDENDNAPLFERPWYSGHVEENCVSCAVSLEGKIMIHDADAGDNAEFMLTLQGEDSGFFTLSQNGSLYTSTKLDREFRDAYALRILATDKGNLSSEVRLTIHVTDINDNPPEFVQMWVHPGEAVELSQLENSTLLIIVGNKTISNQKYINSTYHHLPLVTIPETLMVGFPVLRLLAIDKDIGQNGTISYKLDSEMYIPKAMVTTPFTTHYFTVHPANGEVTVAGLLPPQTEFILNISAIDGGGLESTVTLKLFVKDVNNNPPVFEKSRYYYEILEGLYSGKVLGQVSASDPDFGDNANVSYTVLQKRNSSTKLPFVVSWGGVITVDGELDREKKSVYSFRVMAQDHGPINRRLRSTVDVEIHILDVNDNAPVFHGYDHVAQAVASVLDDPPLQHSNNFEGSLVVPVYTASIAENSSPRTPVARIFANDSDSPTNGNGIILFHIQHISNRPQMFAIDSKDGTIITINNLDYETQSSHNVTIIASDLGQPSQSSTALLHVNVIDVADSHQQSSSPIFAHQYYEFEVEENIAVPLELVTLNVSQEYKSISKHGVIYSIVPGPYSEVFEVGRQNGSVYLVYSPDREVKSKYEVTIRVQPAKKSRGNPHMIFPIQTPNLAPNEVKILLKIKDENDNAPQFALNGRPLVAAIPTTANYGYPIARLQATDADSGANGEIRYQVLGGEADYFTVDPLSGHVRAVASFAHHAGRVFGFDVKATDKCGAHDGHSAIANVFVYVLNEQRKLAMVMGAKPIEIEEQVDDITRKLSNITGLDVRLRMLEPHKEDGEYTDATDMYLYAVDPVMNVIVDTETLNDVLNTKQVDIKQTLEPYNILEVVGRKSNIKPKIKTAKTRAPILTGLEVITIILGCVVFMGALTAAICVACLHKKRKKIEPGFPVNMDVGLVPKGRLDCKPRSLFYPGAFIEDSTDSYMSNHSDCTHRHHVSHHPNHNRHASSCNRHRSRRRMPTRSPSTAMLEMSLASLHSSARDSGIGDPSRVRGRCPCGYSSTHSSANSSNGSYEDSLKSLHRHHSNSSGGSGGGCTHEFTMNRHKRQGSVGGLIVPPPSLARRPSERILIPR